jgi:mannose-6-phosphate isomerase-like protein (cupin superfamily)
MDRIRTIDWSDPDADRSDGFTGVILYHGEGCVIAALNVSPVAEGPQHHVHPHADQIYYVAEGEITVDLDGDVYTMPKGSTAFIPAGLAHRNWNASSEATVLLEIAAPGPSPDFEAISSGSTPTRARNSELATSSVHDPTRPPFVVHGARVEPSGASGIARHWLVNRDGGARYASLYVATLPAGADSGPAQHTHGFDQFYYVLEGVLAIEVGLERHVAVAHNLVVLPAGVPHRIWNDDPEVERHCVILVPEPDVANSALALRSVD